MSGSAVSIMLPALVECLLLVGILSYLGLHVIRRKVIFVDLALAQIAALGATVGFLFGMDPTSTAAFVFALAFSSIGAAIFALTRLRDDRVPQEAVIGLVYAIAAAMAILIVDKSPHGAEHIKDLLTGSILWVKWPQIIASAAAFCLAGVFHYVFRRRFIQISEDPDGAFEAGVWVRLWDFLFYLSFGFVITFAVRTAGVLLVFVFLVAPAISAFLLSENWRARLLVGWTLGTFVSLVAVYLSYAIDVPLGPAVVTFYGAVLLVVAMAAYVFKASDRTRAAKHVILGTITAIAVGAGLWLLGATLGEAHPAPKHHHAQGNASDRPKASTKNSTDEHDDHHHADAQSQTVGSMDPQQRVEALKRAAKAGAKGWREKLVEAVLDPSLPLLFKEDALKLLRARAKKNFGYDAEAENNDAAARKMRAWAKETPAPAPLHPKTESELPHVRQN